jgi:hypothetical protein
MFAFSADLAVPEVEKLAIGRGAFMIRAEHAEVVLKDRCHLLNRFREPPTRPSQYPRLPRV